MRTSFIEWPGFIDHQLLNEVFSATKEDVSDIRLKLDGRTQHALHEIIFVFEYSLELIEYHDELFI